MSIETLGEAWNHGWQLHMRCLDEGREGLKHKRRCAYRTELDMQTLVRAVETSRWHKSPLGCDALDAVVVVWR